MTSFGAVGQQGEGGNCAKVGWRQMKKKRESVLGSRERMKGRAEVRVWTLNLKTLTGKGGERLVRWREAMVMEQLTHTIRQQALRTMNHSPQSIFFYRKRWKMESDSNKRVRWSSWRFSWIEKIRNAYIRRTETNRDKVGEVRLTGCYRSAEMEADDPLWRPLKGSLSLLYFCFYVNVEIWMKQNLF